MKLVGEVGAVSSASPFAWQDCTNEANFPTEHIAKLKQLLGGEDCRVDKNTLLLLPLCVLLS